jgi:cation diffusion facilitator family transporter
LSNLTKKSTKAPKEPVAQQKLAMRLSLAVGVLMLIGKMYAYLITNSAAILSDAAESVVHVFAVSFAAFSLWLSLQPADKSHTYGHDKISFFSAGMEGAMIILAAAFIIFEAVSKWVTGLDIQRLDTGILFVFGASVINAGLGSYLVWQGKKHDSLILIANGKHVLTDFWTSLGVIVGLILVLLTGWLPFDPILAIAVAINILWSGGKLMRVAFGGLMDESNPEIRKKILKILEEEVNARGIGYHQLRQRESGTSIWIEFHLLFPADTRIEEAHWQATEIEAALKSKLAGEVMVTTHLEPLEEHETVHRELKKTKE